MAKEGKVDFSANDLLKSDHGWLINKTIALLMQREEGRQFPNLKKFWEKMADGGTARIAIRIDDMELPIDELFTDIHNAYHDELEAVARDMVSDIFGDLRAKLNKIAEKTEGNIIDAFQASGHMWDFEG